MKPAPFLYSAPRTLGELLELKARHGDDAKFLAGGQSLIPAMNFRLAQPAVLLDLNRLPDLDYVRDNAEGGLTIGALVRHRRVETDGLVAKHQPLVREAVAQVAHAQIRNRGTLCGNLAHADPASEMPAVMLALGARMHARSATSDRWIEAKDFFCGVLETALEEDELLIEVDLPPQPARTGAAFLEVSRRRGDFAMMGVAAIVGLDRKRACAHARLAYCGAGDVPILADDAAGLLIGEELQQANIAEAAAVSAKTLDPPDGVDVSAAYRRQLLRVLTERALMAARDRAGASVS